MSKRLTGLNPLAYLGVEPTSPSNTVMATKSPTANDVQNFNIGDFWVNTTAQQLWVLVSQARGVAVWSPLFGGAADSFVTDSGTATPAGGILNIDGDGVNISTAGSGNTVTITANPDPTFTGLTLTGFTGGVLTSNGAGVVGEVTTTNHSLLVGNSSGTITNLGVATNGQIPIGSTGANPVLATITAGSGVSVTNGAGSITIAATGSGGTVTSITAGTGITLTPSPITTTGSVALTVPVVVANGGTGDTSFTAYSVLCGGTSSTNPLQNVSGVGTSGYILTSNGAGTLPTWQPNMGSSGGAFAFIQKQTAASVTSLAFTTGITSFFNEYLLMFDSIELSTTGADIFLEAQVSTDGGATWKTTGYVNNTVDTAGLDLAIVSSSFAGPTAIVSGQAFFQDFTAGGAADFPSSTSNVFSWDFAAASGFGSQTTGIYSTASTVVNAFRVVVSNGTAFSGRFTLYGLANAGSSGGTLTVDGNSGSATPAAGVLNIVGTGGLSTSASGNTVTISGGSNVPQSTTLHLTNAQIKNLQATPIQILAAQGANTLIVPVEIVSFLNYGGSNAFVAPSGTGINLYFTNVNAGNTIIFNVQSGSSFTQTASNYQISNSAFSAGTVSASCVNQPLFVALDQTASGEITGNAANDNTITIQMQYRVITVPL